jgi:hypothetical protein
MDRLIFAVPKTLLAILKLEFAFGFTFNSAAFYGLDRDRA